MKRLEMRVMFEYTTTKDRKHRPETRSLSEQKSCVDISFLELYRSFRVNLTKIAFSIYRISFKLH